MPDGTFNRFTTHGGGSILKVLLPSGSPEDDKGTLATTASGTDVEPSPDEEPDSGPESDTEDGE